MAALNQITFIGHATLLVEMDGARLLTDPLLRDGVAHLKRRSTPVRKSLYQDIDAVLISHLHRDHLDIPSLRMLGRETKLLLPAGSADFLHDKGFSNIKEMKAGDTTKIGELLILATHAEHHGKHPPFGPTADCLGFLIKGSQTVYFAGDTDLFPGMIDLADNLDVALLPVWGWGFNLGPGHMNPKRAAEALTLLRPRIAIPIHWGTFSPRGLGWFRPSLMFEPPQLFLKEGAIRMPEVKIHNLNPGSSLSLNN
jgi:L-ascorbate metabolism protein UlaG (beta-lactamase superfamily)